MSEGAARRLCVWKEEYNVRMKAHIKERAMSLRTSGHSYAEISALLGISKSTASLWTRHISVGPVGLARMSERRSVSHTRSGQMSHQRKIERIAEAANVANELLSLRDEALIVLSMLYTCEGEKEDGKLCFTNSDETTVRLFMATFRRSFVLDESKFRVLVHIHSYHDDVRTKEYWSKVIGVPISRFYRSYTKESEHKYKKEGYMGCAHIYYHDSHIARVLKGFAKGLANSYI